MDQINTVRVTRLQVPDEFAFPFTPYSIQKLLMEQIYSAVENKELAVFESPTGTGKSMSIICSAVKWLFDAHERDKSDIKSAVNESSLMLESPRNDDDWLDSHHKQAKARDKKYELEKSLRAIGDVEDRVKKLIEKARQIRKGELFEDGRKGRKMVRPKISETRLVDRLSEDTNDTDDDALILMDNILPPTCSDSEEESDSEDFQKFVCPKIFLCSRTHSQLSQLADEISKSPYRELGVRVVTLASRQNMCINDSVLRLKNLSLINEACQDLRSKKSSRATKLSKNGEKLKKIKTSGGCPYTNENNMELLRGECLSTVYDVEEMVANGRSLSACPYYSARNCVEDAHVVLVPYNTLLHRKTREASGINLEGSVVIIDEAHNLLDTLGNIHSSSASGLHICHSHSFLVQYRDRYKDKFSPINLLHLNQLIYVVQKLVRCVAPATIPKEPTSVTNLTNFLIETEIDNINLLTLTDFADRTRLAQKLRGYVDKFQPSVKLPEKVKVVNGGVSSYLKAIVNKSKGVLEESPAGSLHNSRRLAAAASRARSLPLAKAAGYYHSNIRILFLELNPGPVSCGNPIPVLLNLLTALTNHSEDGRVVITVGKSPAESNIKFLLLNPAAHFQDVAKQARSVILAGGTMKPFSEFTDQLFLLSGADPNRIRTFSCDHVVPPSNILPMAVANGPSGRVFDFSYNNRCNLELLDELGRLLVNACCVIPAGVVVFFTSYEYEDRVYKHFLEKGVIKKLETKKKVLREPRQSNQVENVLLEYAEAARNGAILFSVVGGKLSEGLNFNDHLGRCVVVVGLPYPNKTSPELKEKMAYMEQKIGRGSGSIYYENLCMKAVNQSIGRSVRHINDYAAVLLVDQRYSKPNIQAALPQWIRNSLQTHSFYQPIQGNLAKFFSSKKVVS